MTSSSSSTILLEESYYSTTNNMMILQDPPTPVMSNQSSPRAIDPCALVGANGIPPIPPLPTANGGHEHPVNKNGGTSPPLEPSHLNGCASSAWNSFSMSNETTGSPPREPRFSSATEDPIILQRSTILSSSSPSRSDPVSGGRFSSLSPLSFYSGDGGGRSGSTTDGDNRNGVARLVASATVLTSTTSGSPYSSQNIGDWNVYFLILCDFLKSQAPLKLIRQLLQQILRMDFAGGPPGTSLRSTSPPPSPLLSGGLTRRRARHLLRQRPVRISGLPNQGQTCFLNSVLQSLASLPPFLVYLDGITQFQHDMREAGLVSEGGGGSSSNIPAESVSFSQQLLGLLLAINNYDDDDHDDDSVDPNGDGKQTSKTSRSSFHRPGATTRQRNRLDPKGLLRKIGETNQQFKPSSSEQQDAQELLQALLGVVIADAQLDSSTVSSDRFFAYNHHRGIGAGGGDFDSTTGEVLDYGTGALGDDEERLMTAVLANAATGMGSPCTSEDDSFLSRSNSANCSGLVLDADRDSVLTLAGLLLRVGQEQIITAADATATSLNVLAAIKPSLQPLESKQQEELQQDEQDNPMQEEKKQEHLECEQTPSPCAAILPPVTTKHLQTRGNGYSNRTRQPVPKLTNMMRCSISSITPSPLSGWIGSTLRCSKCKHVRPIQNAPFLDIPLVPTSVPNYLAKAYHSGPKIVAPNASAIPSCSLDDCLAEFTSVERVQDVECKSCTIRREVDHLDEEVMMLRGAVETTQKRMTQRNAFADDARSNLEDPCQYLRQDLAKAESKLLHLKTMDPDEDDLTAALEGSCLTEESGFLMDIDEGEQVYTERCEAQKCLLLTRTPSILCCHIQRRYYDPFTNRMEKCVQFVEFPQMLDLSPYCAYGPRASTPWAAGATSKDVCDNGLNVKRIDHDESLGGKMPYRLQSIIEHRGNAFGGHYVSYRRDDLGEWFRISDDTVIKVPWRDVRTCQAYMLFYVAM